MGDAGGLCMPFPLAPVSVGAPGQGIGAVDFAETLALAVTRGCSVPAWEGHWPCCPSSHSCSSVSGSPPSAGLLWEEEFHAVSFTTTITSIFAPHTKAHGLIVAPSILSRETPRIVPRETPSSPESQGTRHHSLPRRPRRKVGLRQVTWLARHLTGDVWR